MCKAAGSSRIQDGLGRGGSPAPRLLSSFVTVPSSPWPFSTLFGNLPQGSAQGPGGGHLAATRLPYSRPRGKLRHGGRPHSAARLRRAGSPRRRLALLGTDRRRSHHSRLRPRPGNVTAHSHAHNAQWPAPRGHRAGDGRRGHCPKPRGPRFFQARKGSETLLGRPPCFGPQEARGAARRPRSFPSGKAPRPSPLPGGRLGSGARPHPGGVRVRPGRAPGRRGSLIGGRRRDPPRPGAAPSEGGANSSRQNRVAGPSPAGYVAPSFFFKPGAGRGLVGWTFTWLTVAGSRGARTFAGPAETPA